MRIIVAAVGRLKTGPERELFAHYSKRLDEIGRSVALGPMRLSEIPESRQDSAAQRRNNEADRLLDTASKGDISIVLDGTGKSLTSDDLAKWLGARRDAGIRIATFLIGGPDGHGSKALDAADLKLSLGPMTLPHGLARIVLAEQLYRAATILAGHPYHRA